MNCLAIECSAKAASAAIVQDGKLIAQYYQNDGLTHSRTLLPMVQNMLSNCGLTLDGIDLLAVSKGPGSFTGLRIGVSTIKGLCWGSDIPCVGVSTLEAMAYNLINAKGIICPVMDARRSQFYNALFRTDGTKLTRITEDRAISAAELQEELKNYDEPIFLVGDGADLCYNTVKCDNMVKPHALLAMQNAWGVAVAAVEHYEAGESCAAGDLVPNYIRLSQAERERLEKLAKENNN